MSGRLAVPVSGLPVATFLKCIYLINLVSQYKKVKIGFHDSESFSPNFFPSIFYLPRVSRLRELKGFVEGVPGSGGTL